ncbi:hypothetical protein E2C01_031770 [Portunus trituberculatus]|uniref:Uncharacterized protein n=1 Tax=Portunus trituberculatus TaxID=210409 RepID=A0A5B7F0Z5_PORTR|nr:hypothetical protein [Portunus trituberculatus]
MEEGAAPGKASKPDTQYTAGECRGEHERKIKYFSRSEQLRKQYTETESRPRNIQGGSCGVGYSLEDSNGAATC